MEYTVEYLINKYYWLLPCDEQYLLEEMCYKEEFDLGDYKGYCEICKKAYSYEYFNHTHLKTKKHITKHKEFENYLIDSAYAETKNL